MAIITEEKKQMQQGYTKTIDESGIMLMFDVLQKYQYSYPVRSTTRELLSNGIDSITEKNMAREILLGRKSVSDFFVDIEGVLYQDSKFDKAYYDLNWLDKKNLVTITYYDGPQMQKDKVVISDTGVGLGGKRLEKYFRLGYSTKRLSKLPLGKFGVGAKSPLSLGIDYYTVESRYNGALYRFNVYSDKVDSIIPQYNLDTMQENKFVWFGEDKFEDDGTGTMVQVQHQYKVYYEDTTLKNGVSITIAAKKSHKNQYIDAVKSQMLYFDGIQFTIVREDGSTENVDYKAQILYEDDYIIMSENQYYTQPHLLLNKVNYGYIDWSELELETKRGNIGIKVQPEEVDVNPSRESVLWTERTKEMVAERFNKVVNIASAMIQEELKESDIIKWLKTCYEISGTTWTRNNVLSRLAGIVDLSNVKPKFNPYPSLEFSSIKPLPGILKRRVSYGERKSLLTGEIKKIIKREEETSLRTHINYPMILIKKGERVSNRKDKYLLSLYSYFILIEEPHGTAEEMEEDNITEDMRTFYNKSDTTGIFRKELWELLNQSTEVLYYEKIEVPENFTGTDEEEVVQETKEEAASQQVSVTTAAERRKLEGKTIVHTLYSQGGFVPFNFTKLEIPIKSINEWQGEEVYCGNDCDDEYDLHNDVGNIIGKEIGLLKMIALITRDPAWDNLIDSPKRSHAANYIDWRTLKWYRLNRDKLSGISEYKAFNMQHYFDSKIRIIKVAQSNNKLYRDFKKPQEFFITIKGKTITMSNLLIQWNTARIIRDRLGSSAFLYNFQQFNPRYSSMYRRLCDYVNLHYREVGNYADSISGLNKITYKDLIGHLDNVQKFQEFVKNPQATAEDVSALASKLFGNADLKDGMAVDPEIISMVEDVHEYAVACGEMLNWIPMLTGYHGPSGSMNYYKNRSDFDIPVTLAFEINRYLEGRGVDKYQTSGIDQPSEGPIEEEQT